MHVCSSSRLCQGVWRYLSATRQHGIFFQSFPDGSRLSDALWCFGDASLAPGASRSRTGVVVKWGDHILAWKSQRQSLTAWSAFEAEVDASATTFQTGVPVKVMLEKVTGHSLGTFFGRRQCCLHSELSEGHDCHSTNSNSPFWHQMFLPERPH